MILNQLLQFIVADNGKWRFGDSGVVVVLPAQDNFFLKEEKILITLNISADAINKPTHEVNFVFNYAKVLYDKPTTRFNKKKL